MDCISEFCFIVLLNAFTLIFKNRFLKRNFKLKEVSCLDKLYFWRKRKAGRGESKDRIHATFCSLFSHSTEHHQGSLDVNDKLSCSNHASLSCHFFHKGCQPFLSVCVSTEG